MNKRRANPISLYLVGVTLFGVTWCGISFAIFFTTYDPANPENMPRSVQAIKSVMLLPITEQMPWSNWVGTHLGGGAGIAFGILGLFVYGLLWGALIILPVSAAIRAMPRKPATNPAND